MKSKRDSHDNTRVTLRHHKKRTRYLMSVETFSEILEIAKQFEDLIPRLVKISLGDAENCENDESAGEDLEERPAEECEAAETLTYTKVQLNSIVFYC